MPTYSPFTSLVKAREVVFIPHILVEVQFGEKKDEAEKRPTFVNNSSFR
jgi:hypothetical protein